MTINSLFKFRVKNIHLIGIGGIGMSGIARILLQSGFFVSGSDISNSATIQELISLGAKIILNHNPKNCAHAHVVVYSSAIKFDNPELIFAQKQNIPILPRALMLAELMRLKCGIAIAGSHGKTTTTSLVGTLMHKIGLDPTIIIGGIVNHFGSNAILGKSQFMVTEADESDGSFTYLTPTIAVVTNIDYEHLDYYQKGIEEIKNIFLNFLNLVPFYGAIIACTDDIHTCEVISKINKPVISYGFNNQAQFRAENIKFNSWKTNFDLVYGNKKTNFNINLTGKHNILNTLASIAVLAQIGIEPECLQNYLENFKGIKRRFMPVFKSKKLFIIDDYAHHPTEIKAVLGAARNSFKNKKIRVLFQPHRYSRTQALMSELSTCFKDCDSLVVTSIFSAQEEPILGVSHNTLVKNINSQNNFTAFAAHNLDDGIDKITSLIQEEDIVFTLGAGSIGSAGSKILTRLQEQNRV